MWLIYKIIMYINHTLLNTNTIMFSLRRSFVINHYIITLVMNILLILCISHNWGKVFIEPNGTPKQLECTLSSRLCVKVATTMPVNHMKAHSCSTPRRVRAPNDIIVKQHRTQLTWFGQKTYTKKSSAIGELELWPKTLLA